MASPSSSGSETGFGITLLIILRAGFLGGAFNAASALLLRIPAMIATFASGKIPVTATLSVWAAISGGGSKSGGGMQRELLCFQHWTTRFAWRVRNGWQWRSDAAKPDVH